MKTRFFISVLMMVLSLSVNANDDIPLSEGGVPFPGGGNNPRSVYEVSASVSNHIVTVSFESLIDSRVVVTESQTGIVLFVNQAARVLGSMRISQGGLTGASVDVRCILREAFMHRATAIALCHNHPSGNLIPSRADDELTHSVLRACRTVDIHMLDHVIFTDGGYYSYADKGRI